MDIIYYANLLNITSNYYFISVWHAYVFECMYVVLHMTMYRGQLAKVSAFLHSRFPG